MVGRRFPEPVRRLHHCGSHQSILHRAGWFLPGTLKKCTTGTKITSPSCNMKQQESLCSREQITVCDFLLVLSSDLFSDESSVSLTSL